MHASDMRHAAPSKVLDVVTLLQESTFPQYAYGILQAAALARSLAVPAITVAELGVAGGNGLVELERLASVIGSATSVEMASIGFDLGSGMPAPVDHRDMSYIWQPGFFRMDESRLRSRLTSSILILGDVTHTGPKFMETAPPPIGFLSFDLDYYSSTVCAMSALLGEHVDRYLPRVFCYFDDTVGPHEELHSEFTGELLAIQEFNASRERRKIAKIHGLRYKLRPLDDPWIEGMHVLHLFDHPRYNEYVFGEQDRQFPLLDPS